MPKTITEIYNDCVARGEIDADPVQARAIELFADLERDLKAWTTDRGKLFGWLRANKPEPPKGLYLHGAVGRGKTMLMDLFFDAAPVRKKRRVHFHAFMAEAHERIGVARGDIEGDPIPRVAEAIASETDLLCFDELHVTDIADAMILGRLFRGLFDHEVVIVATSNVLPDDLYRNGLNRQLFLPFIELIRANMIVAELDVQKDYRLEKLAGQKLFFTPADADAHTRMMRLWKNLTGSRRGDPATLEVKGRIVAVPRAAMGAAWFHFDDLCARPLGSLDYLAIARAYHTIFISEIPRLAPAKRNEARRFINLIDTLYDQRVGLVASSAAEPDEIYEEGDGVDLFQRTASRLIEMRSQSYLEAREERQDISGDPLLPSDEAEAAAGDA